MDKTPALIITYNPSNDLKNQLDLLYQQFDQLLLVDNGSQPEIRNTIETQAQQRGTKLKTILNSRNLGIATALNQGFLLAMELGYEYLIILDQDSQPMPGMKDMLVRTLQMHPNKDNTAVMGSDIVEGLLNKPTRYIQARGLFSFERVSCKEKILRNVSFVITSGSMYNLKLYNQIGPFRDDFFIDAVDTEYCLRAIAKGYEISVACGARLEHRLGNRQQRRFLGKIHSPTFHPPFRWYYISRNRITMINLYARRFPHWFLYEVIITITSLVRMLLFENQRGLKLKAFLYGIRDGLLGRRGEIPAEMGKILIHPQ